MSLRKQLLLLLALLPPILGLHGRDLPSKVDEGMQPEAADAVDSSGAKAWLASGLTLDQRLKIREAFEWGIANQFIPGGALLIIHRGKPVFREAFGLADLETRRPFTVDAPCRIASVTKPHTATLLAMLVEQGKLSWEDPLDKYLRQFSAVAVRGKGPASRQPKIRELLSHTAGFPGNEERRGGQAEYRGNESLAQAVDALARAGLAAEPGSVYAYSGFGYMVAGRVAEVVSGQEFGQLMSDRLLKPIGSTTAVFQPSVLAALRSLMPALYERQDGRLVKAAAAGRDDAGTAFPNPGGGLISTLDDVGRLLLLHRNQGVVSGKQLIAPESLQALYRPQPGTKQDAYGLGFKVERTNARGVGDRLSHGGASGTLALIDFKKDLLVVMLTQVPAKQTRPFGDRLRQAIESVFAER